MLMKIQNPIEPFNTMVRDGTAGQAIGKILEEIKPEAAYFTAENGKRGGTLVVNINDPSEIPRLAQPWFLTLNAKVEFFPCMVPEDLMKAGLEELGKIW